ncbi:telomere stability and silencing-domain-containing protein [Mrakia frigida]|uniref:telomere stability and silencing-domain-containing protein n=1 Tax=Mrakia frigida TaxID=29902 RepID=UPI003FCC18BC
MSSIHLSLLLPSPLPALSLSVPSTTPLSSILPTYCPQLSSSSLLYLRTRSCIPDQDSTLDSLSEDATTMDLQVACRMLGGKGGFGAMLRATGGKMSSQKASNNDSCRDLSGRRLSTIKEAKKMAELLELESTHKKTSSEASKAKLEALERSLGINHNPEASTSSPSTPNGNEPEGSNRPGPSKLTTEDLVQLAGKKHKFDDSEYLEQSREINDNVRSAVSAGLLKNRKKKAKLSASSSSAATPASTSSPAPVVTSSSAASEVITIV